MSEAILTVRGRTIDSTQLEVIQKLASEPEQTRRSLSRALCERFGWARPDGRPWDMACRYLLLRLAERGLVTLPAPRIRWQKRPSIMLTAASDAKAPLTGALRTLGPLECVRVEGASLSMLFGEYIARYHYLGLGTLVGPHLRYLVRTQAGFVAAFGFCGAAWALGPRDRWIGWSREQRQVGLRAIVSQARFLILPWVRIKNLASHLLALSAQWVMRDWHATYGVRPLLLETFVDAERYKGTCYRAANWIHLGLTQGRGKMDRHTRRELPPKDIFVYPLHPQAVEQLRKNG